MRHQYDHLIIGGGMAGEAAAKAIHEIAPDAAIGIIGIGVSPHPEQPGFLQPCAGKRIRRGGAAFQFPPARICAFNDNIGRVASRALVSPGSVAGAPGGATTKRMPER